MKKEKYTPDVLVLTRNNPNDVFDLLGYSSQERWELNKKLTKEFARSLKRQSKNKIKITSANREINALGVKNEDIDFITEIANKPFFKISSGKEIHILGTAQLHLYDETMAEYKKEVKKLKKSNTSDYTLYIKLKHSIYPKYIDKLVNVIQKDINYNTNKLNVSIGDIISFNHGNVNWRTKTNLLYLIENGNKQGAGKVVNITKNGVTINEIVSVTERGSYYGESLGFIVKAQKRNITFKRIIKKYNDNYIPKKDFFTFKDIQHWSKEDLSN